MWESTRWGDASNLATPLPLPVRWSIIWASLWLVVQMKSCLQGLQCFLRIKQSLHASEQKSGPMTASESLTSASFTVPVPELTTSTIPPHATDTPGERFMTDTDKSFSNAVLATNSISVAACLFVITAYFYLQRKYPQVMSRTSLKLSIAMACSDTIYHV